MFIFYPTSQDLKLLTEQRYQRDLSDSDREVLENAARKLRTYVTAGKILGLGLGLFSAFRIRRSKMQKYTAFHTQEKPLHVVFADGRIEAASGLSTVSKPSKFGHVATYTLLGLCGCAIGRDAGGFLGHMSNRKSLNQDPNLKVRVEELHQQLRAEILRKEADALDKKQDLRLSED
ncbi:MAG: hypothetical protein Q9195_005813 [Heterodermia aff. obscurata]